MSPEEHLAKIDALAQRPMLSDPDDRRAFFRRLIAQFTRQINRHKRGLPTDYTREQLAFLITSLERKINETP